jgi:hypothetical protein
MRLTRTLFIIPLNLVCWAVISHAATAAPVEVDRLLASVNSRVITMGDLELAQDLNAILLYGRGDGRQEMAQEVERLIDLEIIRQELENFAIGKADETYVQGRLDELRRAYAEIGGLPALLRRLGMQESELVSYLRLQALIVKFINLRFRPFVSVTETEVQAYYDEKLVPGLRKSGAWVPPVAQVANQIRGVLVEEKINQSMDQWIRNARSTSRIDYFTKSNAAEGDPKR